MSILGRDTQEIIKGKIGLFEKEQYRWLCLASGYQIKWNTLAKHGFV